MKKVCLVVGHNAVDGGAINTELQINEYDYNHVLASKLAEHLHRRNVLPVIVYRGNSYNQLIRDVNETKADFAIELHCNSVVDSSVSGAETLYCYTSDKSHALAQRLQKAVVSVMGERNRGVKGIQDGGRGWAFLRYTNMPSVILEPFFLSRTQSLLLGLDLRETLANVLAGEIANMIKEDMTKNV